MGKMLLFKAFSQFDGTLNIQSERSFGRSVKSDHCQPTLSFQCLSRGLKHVKNLVNYRTLVAAVLDLSVRRYLSSFSPPAYLASQLPRFSVILTLRGQTHTVLDHRIGTQSFIVV